jgi:ketosteroid isomerase-like protein
MGADLGTGTPPGPMDANRFLAILSNAMSQENVETVQRAVEAWNADDLDAYLAELDPDLAWHPSIEPGLEGKTTVYRGHDGARKGWREYRGEAWESLTARPQEIRDLGESVLILGQIGLIARTTGIEFTQEVGQLLEFRGGKIVRVRDFLTHAEALEAAGLSE